MDARTGSEPPPLVPPVHKRCDAEVAGPPRSRPAPAYKLPATAVAGLASSSVSNRQIMSRLELHRIQNGLRSISLYTRKSPTDKCRFSGRHESRTDQLALSIRDEGTRAATGRCSGVRTSEQISPTLVLSGRRSAHPTRIRVWQRLRECIRLLYARSHAAGGNAREQSSTSRSFYQHVHS